MTLHALSRLEGRTIESVSVDSPTEVTLYADGGVRVTLTAELQLALRAPGDSSEFVVATEDGEVVPMRRVLVAEVVG